jgi:hypothetical protein
MKLSELLPHELVEKFPKLGETAEHNNPIVQARFFYPDFPWTWYAIEFDGEDIFYGFVDGDFGEYGTFSLSELRNARGKLGCEIERDLYFEPMLIQEVLKQESLYSKMHY